MNFITNISYNQVSPPMESIICEVTCITSMEMNLITHIFQYQVSPTNKTHYFLGNGHELRMNPITHISHYQVIHQ